MLVNCVEIASERTFISEVVIESNGTIGHIKVD